jgi:hypothetical protein
MDAGTSQSARSYSGWEGVRLSTEKTMRLTMLVLVGLCFLLTVGWLVVGFWVPAAVFVMLGLVGLRSALRIPSSK